MEQRQCARYGRLALGQPMAHIAAAREAGIPHLSEIEAMSRKLDGKTVLITGAVRAPPNAQGRITRAYNSVYVIDHDGSILDIYDKVHLVPFGEYLPFQDLLERWGLMSLTKVQGGFISGERHRAMQRPRGPSFAPLVCYEAIFPGEGVDRSDRPRWLANVTNDAWFGNSSGPRQHLAAARMRAVEEGLPLARAANTGISAVFDAHGREIARLDVGVTGQIAVPLPPPEEPTIFAKFGLLIPGSLSVAALAVGLFGLTRRRR